MLNSSLFALLFFIIATPAWASLHCTSSGLGWHFYCDTTKPKPDENEETLLSPQERLQMIQAKLEELKITAVMEPTEENLKAYVAYQQEQLERASAFSGAWKRMLWRTPELDYSLIKPISSAGNFVWLDEEENKRRKILKSIGSRYGLFFFYTSTCPYCHQYSPILSQFAKEYQINVMPISMDGGALPEWPNASFDRGQFKKLGLNGQPVPATILFDKETEQLRPLGFGLLTRSELEERLVKITSEEL